MSNSSALDLSVTVNGGSWRYETLGAPVALTAGTTYTLAFQVGCRKSGSGWCGTRPRGQNAPHARA